MSIELGLCIGAGYWADTKWGTSPWYLLTGCFFGFLIFTWQLFRLVQSMSKVEASGSKTPKTKTPEPEKNQNETHEKSPNKD
ncbi:AtpZ/AtpI family protein [Thalassoglobus polymorphus]|uniref:AtpZ/AtpI family protein n=1 Tax=Thalassoglobus polymorphus TaxID=2527994 RepID=UPI0018D24E85|nr:AtpZ/AtpI family protein [Thalassoglobus polymorphus]